jgi:hypothetical protein
MSPEVQWSTWASLGRPPDVEIERACVQRNQDGRLEVFASGAGRIFNIWQVAPNGSWNEGWQSKDSPSATIAIVSHVVGTNADGRIEISAIGNDHALWQRSQVAPNNGWSEWRSLGTPGSDIGLTDRLVVGKNQDGRQEVFAIATDGNIWQIWQTTPNGNWSSWRRLGQPSVGIRRADRISVGSNQDLRQELFVMGIDNALWHIWQVAPNVGWSDWASLGQPRDQGFGEPPKDRDLSNPLVQKNADGHLEVFAPGNGAFCNRWQEAPNSNVWRHEGWNAKPSPEVGVGLTWLDAALNVAGPLNRHIEVLGFADDGALWHAWQIDEKPFWSQWHSLGSPPPRIREGDRLTIGANQDGRLETFVMAEDGAVWHTWQTH